METLLTAEQVCEVLQIKLSYLYHLTSNKQIPHFKIGGFLRFRLSEILEWIESKRIDPEEAA